MFNFKHQLWLVVAKHHMNEKNDFLWFFAHCREFFWEWKILFYNFFIFEKNWCIHQIFGLWAQFLPPRIREEYARDIKEFFFFSSSHLLLFCETTWGEAKKIFIHFFLKNFDWFFVVEIFLLSSLII